MQFSQIGHVSWWLKELDKLSRGERCFAPDFLKPFHFVLLALALQRSGTNMIRVPDAVERYAVRMGLWEAVGLEPPCMINRFDPAGRFMPIEKLVDRQAVRESATRLSEIFSLSDATDETVSSLWVALSEILENCFAHAAVGEGLHGLACAQNWPAGSKAQIAIADSGVGIRESLGENLALADRLDVENSCEMATQYGVTGKPGRGHSGYGLSVTRELLARNGGNLLVCSDTEYFQSIGDGSSSGRLRQPMKGTLVVLEWNTNIPLDVKTVYAAWPLPEGYTDDDFDF